MEILFTFSGFHYFILITKAKSKRQIFLEQEFSFNDQSVNLVVLLGFHILICYQ